MYEPICVASAAGGRPGWYAAKAAISDTSSVAGAVSPALTYVPPCGFDATIAKLYTGVGVAVGETVRETVGCAEGVALELAPAASETVGLAVGVAVVDSGGATHESTLAKPPAPGAYVVEAPMLKVTLLITVTFDVALTYEAPPPPAAGHVVDPAPPPPEK